ncbi:Cobalt transport protein CbiN [Candidatus Terasakiella magnetica]|nr:Cobalt transport protein CbiN [Candidatus Terasakiella magnetica]
MSARSNTLLLGLAALIVAAPLILNPDAPFGGTDDAARDVVASANPDYKPWSQPLWQPPGKEMEGLLFALQAAAGAGLLGYVIGRRHGRSDK